ncbi:hypothetical protein A3D00_03675 [Candidatus Woesebacteria bacterium RIFCSPHIGHO2_02_FULL_38_9]|uniref:Uncharacterized protein n=1 Tax=Candidatus Woesebacteria bacterium RIFCSPHIGHO2_01_FULL_39_28 TaxID=1802496 RepID=A0A1F7YJ68_9BACT|nr:MAG: hypothetical protein A2627_01000 [Candidatus Woesebacteria bacterium RIFCSPHIGHO2_01_FULL_39_28]OGM32594.1 MAG: hypothetical protein A3D00_03675 [Candidatus Woesebacteria bacterium RIFCSPHIGHO2_02_FULL_38_9]OGM57716.1 MAG: hypothetical protein A3A50_01770 [Candidatus Woesebacteria bacterium RIFCSPLOWO2_01_FULL_38_20]
MDTANNLPNNTLPKPTEPANTELIPPKKRKLLIIGAIFIVSLLFLNILGRIIITIRSGPKENTTNVVITPKTTSFGQEILNPSKYASDPEVLKIETDISNLEKNFTEKDIREFRLSSPTFDFEMDFGK